MTLVPVQRRRGRRNQFAAFPEIASWLFDDALPSLLEDSKLGSWTPDVDIREEEGAYYVKADIPGIDPQDIELTLDKGVLTIKGERIQLDDSENKSGYHRVERSYGSFVRSFRFPDTVDADAIEASGSNGVLEITIPKKEAAKPKKIAVK